MGGNMNKTLLISCLLFALPLKSAEIPQHIKTLLLGLSKAAPRSTGFFERREYGYHGDMVPIYAVRNKSNDQQIGCIITNAQPVIWGGLSSTSRCEPTNHIFLDEGLTQYSAKIKTQDQSILACVAENNEKIVIAWTYPFFTMINLYATLADVDSVKQGKDIDLSGSKFNKTGIELKD